MSKNEINQKAKIKQYIIDTLMLRAKKDFDLEIIVRIVQDVMQASAEYNGCEENNPLITEENIKKVQGLFVPPRKNKKAAIFISENTIDKHFTYIQVMEHEYEHLRVFVRFCKKYYGVDFESCNCHDNFYFSIISEFNAFLTGYNKYFEHIKEQLDETRFIEFAKAYKDCVIGGFNAIKEIRDFNDTLIFIYHCTGIMAFVTVCQKHIADYKAVEFFSEFKKVKNISLLEAFLAFAQLIRFDYNEKSLQEIEAAINELGGKLLIDLRNNA